MIWLDDDDIARLREEHPKHPDGDICAGVGCGWAWPCPTLRLLDETLTRRAIAPLTDAAREYADAKHGFDRLNERAYLTQPQYAEREDYRHRMFAARDGVLRAALTVFPDE